MALPPFLPVGRGEDLLFCAMVERFLEAPSAHVALAVAHVPPAGRRFQEGGLWRSARSLDLCQVMFAFLHTLPAGADLMAFGRHLQACAADDDKGFVAALREARRTLGERLVADARRRMAELDSLPSFWRADLERFCALNEAAWRAPELPWVVDAGALDAEESLRSTRALVARYGALCTAWPTLWAAAAVRPKMEPPQRPRTASTGSPRTCACSPWQTGFLQSYLFEAAAAANVVVQGYRGSGVLDDACLDQALRAVAGRHECLRSRLVRTSDLDPRLEIHSASELVLERQGPLSSTAMTAARTALQTRSFDLYGAPPLRLSLLRGENPEHWELWLAVHHGFFDGLSLQLFWHECSVAYANLQGRRETALGLPRLQDGYYARAERLRQCLQPELLASRERWVRRKLAGACEAAPVSRSRQPPDRIDTCWLLQHDLPTSLPLRLRLISRTHHVSLASLCLAAWQAVIHHWSGAPDFLLGVDTANRWEEEDALHIGEYAVAVPVRSSFATDRSLAALIEAVHADLTDAMAQGCLPAERMARLLTHSRRKQTLFPLMFSYLDKSAPPAFGYASMTPIAQEQGQATYDLGLTVECTPSALQLSLLGNAALFDRQEICRIAAALQRVLEQMADDPGMGIAALRFLSEEDAARIRAWNSTAAAYPRDEPLTEVLRASVERAPDAVALQCEAQTLTYRELWRRAEALAARLRSRGVQRDARVALYLDRNPRLMEGMLGILLAGGGYLPIDTAYPSARTAFMLEDAAVDVIVTRRGLRNALPPHHAEVICVDSDEPPGTLPVEWQGPTPESLAYVIYTSGSTGLPKGVEVTHRAMVNFLFSLRREPGLAANDVMLALTTISFDIAGLEWWLPLLVGARVWLAPREAVADGPSLMKVLAQSRATVMQATPSTWRLLLDSNRWPGDARLKALVGGEALPPDLAWRLARACGEAWNLYGPTEATIWATLWRIPSDPTPVRIGRPIANTEVHVLDQHYRPQPPGVTGDLFIGGEAVARGYLRRPELTAERFIADPFRGGAARMYRTGDLGRWTLDGQLECLGRSDAQIKINGHRIEPAEVEAAILRLPEVGQAAVGVGPGPGGEGRLVAFVVPRPGSSLPSGAAIRGRLRGFLLDHMLPLQFIHMDKLPTTPNGKLDRQQLAAAYKPSIDETQLTESVTEAESALIDEFSAVLGQRLGADVDFFDAGGSSLMALQLIVRLRNRFCVHIAGGELFQWSTPRQMARRIAALTGRGAAPITGHLVAMRTTVARRSLIFVHPRGGQLLAYAQLAPLIDPQVALYGFEGFFERDYKSLEERATAYARELNRKQPDGRIALCGYSLGGAIALEIAAQLERCGRSVGPVFFIDSSIPRKPPKIWEKLLFRAVELKRFTNAERVIWLKVQLRRFTRGMPADFAEDPDELGGPTVQAQVRRLLLQAENWQAPRYEGVLVLFRAELDMRGYTKPPRHIGWDDVYPQLEIVRWRCDHYSIIAQPTAQQMAREINRRLQTPAAQSGAPMQA